MGNAVWLWRRRLGGWRACPAGDNPHVLGDTEVKAVWILAVIPSLLAPVERMRDLARHPRWSWSGDGVEIFRGVDRDQDAP